MKAQAAEHHAGDPDLTVPPKVAGALIAVEDARFSANKGIDPTGVARAAMSPQPGR